MLSCSTLALDSEVLCQVPASFFYLRGEWRKEAKECVMSSRTTFVQAKDFNNEEWAEAEMELWGFRKRKG